MQNLAELPIDATEPHPLLMPLTIFSHNLLGQFTQTFVQNLESVAQEMSELCSILRFGNHFIFWRPFCFSLGLSIKLKGFTELGVPAPFFS